MATQQPVDFFKKYSQLIRESSECADGQPCDTKEVDEGLADDFLSVAKKVQPNAKLAPKGGFRKPESDTLPVKKSPVDHDTGDIQKDYYSQPSDKPRYVGDSKINKGKIMSEQTGTLYEPENAAEFNKLTRGTKWTKMNEQRFQALLKKGRVFVWEGVDGKYAFSFGTGNIINEQSKRVAASMFESHPALGGLVKSKGNPIRAGLTESTRRKPVNLFLEAYKNRGLMEGVSDRVLTKRKMIVSEARKLITLAESAKMPESTRRAFMSEAQKAIIQAKSGKLSEAQLDNIGEGIWGGVKALGAAAGRGIADKAKEYGTKIGNVASKVGDKVKDAATEMGHIAQQGSNAQDAKQAIGSLNQISQLLAKTGTEVKDNMTVGQVKQALNGMAGA